MVSYGARISGLGADKWRSRGAIFGLWVIGVLAVAGETCLAGQQAPGGPPSEQNPTVTPASELPAKPIQTPGEIYKSAMHPLDVVRSSLDNWSDAELGALAVGMHEAHDACEVAKPEEYSGDNLYDLVRLCALGQDWEKANAAAQAYIRSKLVPHLAQAYALSINAMVHVGAVDLAVETTREMLGRLPYDAEVAYAVRYMKEDLEQASNPAALELATEEHSALVAALKQNAPLKAQGDAVMSLGALYESGMELAFWQRYSGDAAGASTTAADLDQALSPDAQLSTDDATRIAAVRLRYGLLGSRFPEIKATRSLESTTAKAVIRTGDGELTVLVLFPDWCGGCRNMMKPLTEFAKVNKTTPIRAFGLVFEDSSVIPEGSAHEQFLKELKGTSTLVVPPSTAQTIGANDFPTGIVLDREGKVRFIGALPLNAFNGGGYVEKTILRVAGSQTGDRRPASASKKK